MGGPTHIDSESASRVARRLVIVSQDLPVHGQPSAATSPEVLHHLNDTLVDNDRDTESVSRATERDNREFTAAGAQIAGVGVLFDVTVDDGAERVPVVEAGSATPVAQNDDNDHEMGVSEAGADGVFEFIENQKRTRLFHELPGCEKNCCRWIDGICQIPSKKRGCVIRSVPRFSAGPATSALRVALEEATSEQLCCQERGCKLLCFVTTHVAAPSPTRRIGQKRN